MTWKGPTPLRRVDKILVLACLACLGWLGLNGIFTLLRCYEPRVCALPAIRHLIDCDCTNPCATPCREPAGPPAESRQ
jgi:hypothetical protein